MAQGGGAGSWSANSLEVNYHGASSKQVLVCAATLSQVWARDRKGREIEKDIGGTCFYVSAETFSIEFLFPKTPESNANSRTASAASGAASGPDYEKN